LFIAIAAKTMRAINVDGIEFLEWDVLGRRITQAIDDNREKAFLYQRLSVVCTDRALQRSRRSWHICPHNLWGRVLAVPAYQFLTFNCFNRRDLYYRGYLIIIIIDRQRRIDLRGLGRHYCSLCMVIDWLKSLNALPIASCRLRMDDESAEVAEALCLRLSVCVPHSCSCGAGENVHGVSKTNLFLL